MESRLFRLADGVEHGLTLVNKVNSLDEAMTNQEWQEAGIASLSYDMLLDYLCTSCSPSTFCDFILYSKSFPLLFMGFLLADYLALYFAHNTGSDTMNSKIVCIMNMMLFSLLVDSFVLDDYTSDSQIPSVSLIHMNPFDLLERYLGHQDSYISQMFDGFCRLSYLAKQDILDDMYESFQTFTHFPSNFPDAQKYMQITVTSHQWFLDIINSLPRWLSFTPDALCQRMPDIDRYTAIAIHISHMNRALSFCESLSVEMRQVLHTFLERDSKVAYLSPNSHASLLSQHTDYIDSYKAFTKTTFTYDQVRDLVQAYISAEQLFAGFQERALASIRLKHGNAVDPCDIGLMYTTGDAGRAVVHAASASILNQEFCDMYTSLLDMNVSVPYADHKLPIQIPSRICIAYQVDGDYSGDHYIWLGGAGSEYNNCYEIISQILNCS